MWKVLFFAVCVAIFHVALSGDEEPQKLTIIKPLPIPTEPSCGCGGGHPPRCGKNEVYDNCIDTSCRPTLCSQLGYPLDCNKKCKPGCKCKKDYVRDDKGVCIPILQCPSCGGNPNATSGCGNNCGKMCGDIPGKPGACSTACAVNGCDCRDGYQYDRHQNACVKKEDCTPNCKENEEYSPCSNGGCGPKNCSQINDPYICIDPICKKGCVCKKGYLRDAKGKCVPKEQCPKQPRCDKNEVYDNCTVKSCRPTLCSQLGYPLDCNKKCKPGCKCKDNYVRNDKGICIPILTCPSCGGDKNAQSGCGINCGKTCASVGKKNVFCPLICKLNSCDCRDGFYYDPNQKKCVRKEDCTPTCKNNEVYSSCINGGCGPKNCSQINRPTVCVHPVNCVKGCICKEGYLRAQNGTCIPRDQCPKNCTGPHEHYEPCIQNCGSQNCSDIGKNYHCPRIVPGICFTSGCQCDYGYLRNASGICIPQKNCPPLKCPPNQKWDPCPTVPCEGDYCPKTKDSPQTCPIGIVCDPPRCVCDYNRKKAANGTCIHITHCPPFKCPKNEEYQACPYSCPGEKCSDYTHKKKCPINKMTVTCRPACKCKKGYYRNDDGDCILASDCPGATTTQRPTTTPKPTKKCTGPHEHYEPCIQNCGSQNCSDIGKIYHCPKTAPGICFKSGCVCDYGYLRNASGICIPQKNCPPLKCPPNQKWDPCPTVPCEGDYCPKTKDSPQTCPIGIVCDKPRCVCGYNSKKADNGTCISILDCPPFKCPKNEEYHACPDSCPGEKCSDYTYKTKCPPYRIGIIVNCRPRCQCKKGYYRNDHGDCIVACDCPAATTTQKPTTTPEPTPEPCD